MLKHNQNGAVSGLAISLIMTILLLVGALGFGIWSFSQMQDYKNNSDEKSAVAVEDANKTLTDKLNKQFAEKYKEPLEDYKGPDAYGSLRLKYPKTWSGYVDEKGSGNILVNGYFAPGVVPALTDKGSTFALRLQVLEQSYANVIKQFEKAQQAGKMSVEAYTLPNLPKIVGVRATGQLNDEKTVDMVVLPLRFQTVQIWTEGDQFADDFEDNILENFSFSP